MPMSLPPGTVVGGVGAVVKKGRNLASQVALKSADATRKVKAMVQKAAFDVGALEHYLAERIEGFRGPLAVRQFRGGQSNPTYYLEAGGREYVLRRKPPGKLLPSAHAVDREFRVISAPHAQAFPVAAPVLYFADAGVAGTPVYVCLLYPSEAADDPLCVDLGGRRIIKKKKVASRTRISADITPTSAASLHAHFARRPSSIY